MDISASMLSVALERESEGDLMLGDLGNGLPLRAHAFDGAVSISAVQWLCNADTAGADPRARLRRFFASLYRCLCRGARAVLQLYPSGPEQAEMITSAALRVGFSGGLVVDFPNSTRAKKYFLVLMAGPGAAPPRGKDGEGAEEADGVAVAGRRARRGKGDAGAPRGLMGGGKRHPHQKGKAWVMKKKEQMRGRGVEVPDDSRYTARKRRRAF
jgi:18S rRNA (guanine1575-N7)-methyltransferase